MTKTAKIRAALSGILIAILLVEAFDFFGGYDFIKAGLYQPNEEMSDLISNLELTSRGERILKATKPSLDSKELFNEKCDSHKAEIYVLGCYLTGDDQIHLYDVDETELSGVKESTAAHELLHAVYLRLPFWEKDSLNQKLQSVYDSLAEDDDIKTSLKLYSDNDFYDELHSRLGTEIKDLPYELEKHYEAIFKNQDMVVDYYEKYSGTFKKYEKETEALGKRLETMQTEIDEEERRLAELSKDLNKRIENYNSRVSSHSYTDVRTIRAEGDSLQAEVNSINAAYDALNQKIDEYNNLIVEYNNSVIRTNQIFNSINSNSEQFETVNN